jgi:vitamin K-dependent gamma-carboxylase
MIDRARALLARATVPVDAAGLVAFRIALGLLVSVSAVRFLAYGWVSELFVEPTFFFKYWGLSWVRALPAPGMHVVFVALAVLGAAFAAGLLYRIVAPSLFVLFAYVQAVDVTNWLNHYYLVSLLLLLASTMPLGRAASIDAWLFPERRLTRFPAWCTWLFRFQVGVVYVYAGLAKLTRDWLLHAQPLDIWLHARTDMPIVGAFFDERWAAYLFSWGGFLFDTTIVLFLLWRRTRVAAYAVVIGFHAMVGLLFPIGMFPFIMVTAVLVFFPADWPRRVLAKLRPGSAPAVPPVLPPRAASSAAPRRAFVILAAAYCVLQVVVPLRHRIYGGNVLWHEQGMRFSWKVMVREKNGSITYLVDSPSQGRTWYVSPRKYLTARQERELSGQPDLVLQLAHHIQRDFQARGLTDARVRVEAIVSLNGRSAAPMIDPDVDLSRVEDGLGKAHWILPEPEGPPIHLRKWHGVRLASASGS